MGFPENIGRNPTVESDTIVGVIDSGIWPESESFNDNGFGPPPYKWKGACNGGINFTCNNKLIGARYYTDNSARDLIGHGSHTASTAAGNRVPGTSFYGIAAGTARGGVPSARVAAYKACSQDECETAALLAAFDDAIADGVDLISISIGGAPMDLEDDAGISLGALHAFERGILVVQSAGNKGTKGTVASVMPWIFTAAAATTDRGIVTRVALGDGNTFTGKAVSSTPMGSTTGVPVEFGKNVSGACDEYALWRCDSQCMQPSVVKGKVVLCNDYYGVRRAFTAGALGVVGTLESFPIKLPFPMDFSQVSPLASSHLNNHDFQHVQTYFESTKSPTLDILKSDSIRNVDAPKVAGFSSRGPNVILPDVLKPDITAPGVEILAAFSPLASPSEYPSDRRSVKYSIMSGTSMACPHVTGAAAYVKSFHPDWSPSAIKSALMTTARTMDASKDRLAEFSYGAGYIDPVKAVDPGLVYETFTEDYISMFCGLGYDSTKVRRIFGGNASCPQGPLLKPKDLNYPSLTSQIKTRRGDKAPTFVIKFRRTVTHVGHGRARYTVTTSAGPTHNITVQPSILRFRKPGQKRSFNVIISGVIDKGIMLSASLVWSDGVRKVRSPIVVYRNHL
ncbi:subtilase 4.13 [Striga hermonthica]|uniref:Subtilase 4.13 n=1 Tax=Striga hermonthica TaxID=68872 RepID=A0A9N7NR97_STRHE|nr:subtilase 4.13 [Striga hermonthica]